MAESTSFKAGSGNSIVTSDPEKDLSIPPSPSNEEQVQDDSEYISGVKLGLLIMGLCFCVLLVGLDNSILATAIPTITTDFNSLDDVGWYGSAFLVCVCALQPLSGKLYTYFSLKWIYLCFLATFELGSLICATAVSSVMLIVGRAVAGMGAAGLFSGALIILTHAVPLRQRPIYTGLIVSMFGISSIVGPILGGTFTTYATWRWCFYINLPLGAITAIVLMLLFHPKTDENSRLPFAQKIKHLDIPGLVLFIPAVLMLLLAVQWGGNKHAWKSATTIGLIIGFFFLVCIFVVWQIYQKDEAGIPSRIMGQRSVYSAAGAVFCGMGAVQLTAYYIPMYFQVIKNNTAEESGIRFLPVVLGNFVGSIVSGGLVTKFGHFNPWLFFGTAILAITGGIYSTFKVDTQDPLINGIGVLTGLASSCVIQMPMIGLMSILPQRDIPVASSISVFFQFFGGALFLSIAENILVTRLVSALHSYAPSVDSQAVVAAGAAGLRKVVSVEELSGSLMAYDKAITMTFYLCVSGAAAAFLFSFGMEWRSVKEEQKK